MIVWSDGPRWLADQGERKPRGLWGYKPSVENMKRIMDIMAFDRALVTDELAELRYRATIRPGARSFGGFSRLIRGGWMRRRCPLRRFNRSTTRCLLSMVATTAW